MKLSFTTVSRNVTLINEPEIEKKSISVFKNGKVEDLSCKKIASSSSCVVTNTNVSGCYDLPVTFCGFIPHLIGRETINIPQIIFGVYGLTQ